MHSSRKADYRMTRLFAGTQFDVPPRCDRCNKLEEQCECPPPEKTFSDPSGQQAKVRADRRKHKRIFTVVWGLSPDETDLPALLSKLKAACGAGGSVQEEQIELQGDHVTRVRKLLAELGYKVR